jgi:hypothetical protein
MFRRSFLRSFLRSVALGQLPETHVSALRGVCVAALRGGAPPSAASLLRQGSPFQSALGHVLRQRRTLFIQTQPTPNPQR